MPWATKVGVSSMNQEDELDDTYDELIQCDPEFERVYVVPRPSLCNSALYLSYVNIFGNNGGFDKIIELLLNPNVETEFKDCNITVLGCLA